MKFNTLDTIMLDSLKQTAKKTETSKLQLALTNLKSARAKFEKTASKRDNEFNAKQISIITKELKSRK
jgi:hypothetical protein